MKAKVFLMFIPILNLASFAQAQAIRQFPSDLVIESDLKPISIPRRPGFKPISPRNPCDSSPEISNCSPSIEIPIEAPSRPSFPRNPTLSCKVFSEAEFFRATNANLHTQPYLSFLNSIDNFFKKPKPEIADCLTKIPDALECQMEQRANSLFKDACLKLGDLDFDVAQYLDSCRAQLDKSYDANGSNELALSLKKIAERDYCSLDQMKKSLDTPKSAQPECVDGNHCIGSNITQIPKQVRLYRFAGNRGLRWNHSLKLVHEYNPRDWRVPPSTVPHIIYNQAMPDCEPQDFQNMYLTDRLKNRVQLDSVSVYTHSEVFKTKTAWDDWNENKIEVFEKNAPIFELKDYGPDIFIDVYPKDGSGNKIEHTLDILSNLESRKLSSEHCKIRVVSVTSLPTEGSIVAINTEAARLLDNIESTGKAYLNAKKYDDFIKQFELPRLETSVLALESSFKTLIKAAMSGSCEELPPPPFLPISGFVPYGPDAELTSCEDAGKNPADYGLQATDWSNIDLKALNLFVFNEEEKGYRLNLSLEKTPWYFEARERQPRIRDAIEKTLVEIAQIMTGIYFKKNPSALPEDYKLPELAKAHEDLGDAMEFARTFLSAFDAYKDTLSEKLEEIRTKIKAYDDSKGITTTTTPS